MERTAATGTDRLTIGQLARRGGVHLETIRYYERRGLLPKPPRSLSGHRTFSKAAVRRVRFIKRAQAIGFSLQEIRELLSLRATPEAQCVDVRTRAEAKLAEVEEKIRSLMAIRQALTRLITECSARRRSLTDCPILDALDAEDTA